MRIQPVVEESVGLPDFSVSNGTERSQKKAFATPKLIRYGDLQTLTQSGGSPGKEGPGVGNSVRKP